nr:hypothetical protein [Morchella crassipes]
MPLLYAFALCLCFMFGGGDPHVVKRGRLWKRERGRSYAKDLFIPPPFRLFPKPTPTPPPTQGAPTPFLGTPPPIAISVSLSYGGEMHLPPPLRPLSTFFFSIFNWKKKGGPRAISLLLGGARYARPPQQKEEGGSVPPRRGGDARGGGCAPPLAA